MKLILKNKEPRSLAQTRSTLGSGFESCDKEDIRESLLQEQGHICAYCMQRIGRERNAALSKPKTEIEHFKPQDIYDGTNGKPDLRLVYNNMLAVCNGNAGQTGKESHCDKSKGNKEITLNPLDPSCETRLKFGSNGKVSSDNPVFEADIKTLNLNQTKLTENRRMVIAEAIKFLNAKKSPNHSGWTASAINAEIVKWQSKRAEKRWDENGNPLPNDMKHAPFCQAVVSFFKKRMAQAVR